MRKIILFVLILIASVDICPAYNDYTFSCWPNGWRKNSNDRSPDLFAVKTSKYGFVLDMDDFSNAKIGLLSNSVSYEQTLEHKAEKLINLPATRLLVDINVDGVRYRAKTCKAGLDKGVKRLSSARLWESGRYVQHYDFLGLDFRNTKGQKLLCDARLDLVAWPDTLTLNLYVSPQSDMKNVSMCLGLRGNQGSWIEELKVDGAWKKDDSKSISLTCKLPSAGNKVSAKIHVKANTGQDIPVSFDKTKNCYVASVKRLNRKWKAGYTDIRNYDEFKITVNSQDSSCPIPFLLDMRGPANITGLCPILCDENGRPIGIPVQLSKNWHYSAMGAYLMAYTMLPVEKNATYILRITYGFYGQLPSASHSQLSLVGYHNTNGRWDQLAIGCWGETICFDMDMSCVDNIITDIRMLMARPGIDGKKWSWTDAGWGGDWLYIKDARQNKYFLNGIKTAYLSHGPCLTDVRHAGYYGMNKEIDFEAQIQTLRTDDYARTFQKLSYVFNSDVSAKKIWLFKLGRTYRYSTPKLAYGNIEGLINQHDVPDNLKANQIFLKNTTLTGSGPWWVGLPGAQNTTRKDRGTGYRALIIRDYKVLAGGKTYTHPTIRAPVFNANPRNIDIELVLPDGVTNFKKGDSIQLDLELITLHRCAADYYGPNEAYRKHLAEAPNSWETAHREAVGNDLKLVTLGGEAIQDYPVVIKTYKPEVKLMIRGGVGAVPIRFEGLKSTEGYSLYQQINGKRVKFDQSVHGNDFWQTDYDPLTDSYMMTYNVPLDGLKTSHWILTQK